MQTTEEVAEPVTEGPVGKRLFVAGLAWATTDDAFQLFFSQFGEVKECQIMREPSKKSRGFGFVVFKDDDVADKVLNNQNLQLDGRKLDLKPAVSKEELANQNPQLPQPVPNKVWVAGLAYDTNEEALLNYFSQLGKV